jgi:hypothetical protein
MSDQKAPKKQELKIHVVNVLIDPGIHNVMPFARRFFVEHYSRSQAEAWLIKEAVTSRIASQADIIAMTKAGIAPIGPYAQREDAASQDQGDIESEIDRVNRENAALLNSNGDGGPTSRFAMEPPTSEN